MDLSGLVSVMRQLQGAASNGSNMNNQIVGVGPGTTWGTSTVTIGLPMKSVPYSGVKADVVTPAPTAKDVQQPAAPSIILPEVVRQSQDTFLQKQAVYENQRRQTKTNFQTGNLGNLSLLDQPTLLGS